MKRSIRFLTHSVVVQLIIGALIKAWFPFASTIENYLSWTTFSVIGLFMTVGLQLHPEKFRKDFKLSVFLVLLTTLFPMVLFYAMAKGFALSDLGSWTVAVVLVTTGTGVTIQTLLNLGILRTKVGEFITLISALDDIPAAIVMAVLLTIAPVVKLPSTTTNWLWAAGAIVTFLILFFLRNRVLSQKDLIISLVLLAFGVSSSKFMEAFHVSVVMGGLLSGVFISLTLGSFGDSASHFIDKVLRPVLILYMVYIGMKLSPSIFKSAWAMTFAGSFIIAGILSKWVTTYLLMRKHKDLHPDLVAWGMVPRGIPGFAFASASVAAGLIDNEIFTILILVVSVTTWIGLIGIEYSARKKNLVKF